VRKLRQMPASAVLLFEDEIIIRLFPVLRRAWALQGEQAKVSISGYNAKRVLFGAINMHTGHRIVMRYANMGQQGFQDFLRLLRRRYQARPIWLLLDAAQAHRAIKSQLLAKQLNVELIWLPKQCPELNAMDHLWKELKAHISANYQHPHIEEHVRFAEQYTLRLTNNQALKKAGILSENFWLKAFLK
jgi:transposase